MPKSSTDLNSLDTSIVNDNDEDENSFKIVFETGGDDSESEEEEQEYPEESEVSDDTVLTKNYVKSILFFFSGVRWRHYFQRG